MVAAMAESESRISRWSRLKSKGGADPREETQAVEEKAQVATAREQTPAAFLKLPGGARVRRFVPALPPLAPLAEDDDDVLTRGVGHAPEGDDEAAGGTGDDRADAAYAEVDPETLSDEEKEIVASLPPLDQLTEASDFSPFFKEGVPELIKRQAMRVLWRTVPFFNVRDGLNDYDEDFNVIHKLISELTGNYRVGRGHLSDQELRDMMPEEARKAFDDDVAEDEPEDVAVASSGDSDNAAADDQEKDPDEARKKAEMVGNDPEADADDIGDGEDDPNV